MPKNVWLLILGMLISVVGSSFLWPMNAIYLHDHLGQTMTVAGFVLMLNAGASVLGSLVGGFLFDKIGGYKTVLIGAVSSIIILIFFVMWHEWPHYAYFLTLLGFSGGLIFPSMFAMVGLAWPEGGRKGFNAIYLASNLGVAVGPALAGVVANYSFNYLFIANLIMYVLFLAVALFLYKIPREKKRSLHTPKPTVQLNSKAPLMALSILGIGFLLSWAVYSQWASTISTYTQSLGISLNQYSLLWTVNGLLIVLGQPLVNPIIRRMKDNYKGQIAIGIFIFFISFVVLAYAQDFKMFLASIIILTIGEMFVWPIVPTIADQLAPPGKEGSYQGFINSFNAIGKMVGPFVGGILVDVYGMPMLFYVLLATLVVAMIPYMLYDRPLKKKHNMS